MVMDWTADALYDKSKLFMARAHEQPVESQLFAFWASLSLELLARGALAKVHPVLLADPREDGSILYAFGIQPAKPPKSIVTKAIVIRCAQLVEGFTDDMAKHCALMADQRNTELHSGAVGFDDFDNAAWLPGTYEVIEVLLKHLGKDWKDFLGDDHAAAAIEMLSDRRETIKKQVQDRISTAKKLFAGLAAEEKTKRAGQWAATAKELLQANRRLSREIKCPACGLSGLVAGSVVGRGPVRIDETSNTIDREVRILPTKFRCTHCELKLDGFQELRQANLGNVYTMQESEDPIEFFGIDPADYIDPDQFLADNFGPDYDNE
jgi:hypothetical protein